MRKCLVVSAVNFSEGGALTVLRDCLDAAALSLPPEWEIIALVHDRKLIDQSRVRLIELPTAKRSWLLRLYYEWFYFKKLSLKFKPDLWLSLHDITPRVTARRQVVYCHNPSPFYQLPWREAWFEPKLWIFNSFYQYLYQVFIRRNFWVVVQQAWLRDAFKRMYGPLPIVVAHPSPSSPIKSGHITGDGEKVIFLYPALPRVFKNFELIGEAAKILNSRNMTSFEIRITLSGKENRYSKWLYANYGPVPRFKFVGLQSRTEMAKQYSDATVVIFPSKLETWGLPISEAKFYNKDLLVADIPYARETVGTYDRVDFFPSSNADELANLMQAIIEGRWQPSGADSKKPSPPFVHNWDELLYLLTQGL